tara:strand:- start:148 stop:282 length:135 start_codon:yes stop_codon:yes gene_type:complete
MKEKLNNFKSWYVSKYKNNKKVFILVHAFIAIVLIAEIIRLIKS